MNSKDPIAQNPDAARELFRQLAQVSHGFGSEDVINAAFNLVINAVRQAQPARQRAEVSWDEAAARAKGALMNCYDSTGRKKGIFPYTQNLDVSFIRFPDKINGG